MRAKGEARLDRALGALASALNSTRTEWMVIGGIAVIARGVRRVTTDVDAVIRGDETNVEALLRTLARYDIAPRIEEAATFARQNLVLLLRHSPTGVDLDLSFGWTAFEREAIASSTKVTYRARSLPMARAEDLIIFKALAARPKDIQDATTLLLMHKDIDLKRVRKRVAELAALAEEPVLLEGLENVIREVARTKRDATRATAKKPKAKPTRRRSRRSPSK